MKFTLLTTAFLTSTALAAPSTLLFPRKSIDIDFASCVTKGVDSVHRSNPDANLLRVRALSDHFGAVQHVNGLNVLELTFDSQSTGGAIVIRTKQYTESPHIGDSYGCVFGEERVVPGHTMIGAGFIDWPSDAGVGILAAGDAFLKDKRWDPFGSVTLTKGLGAPQATYAFEINAGENVIKVGAKDGKVF